MSRLDHHVGTVRIRMATSLFLRAVAWTVVVYAGVIFLGILLNRFGPYPLQVAAAWLWAGLGVSVALAVAYAIRFWPSRHEAAVAIDRAMGLNEKFSTALYARNSTDPFAMAAVRDAEMTADRVTLRNTSPIRPPLLLGGVPGLVVLMLVVIYGFGPRPPASADAGTQTAKGQNGKAAQEAKKLLDQAMDTIAAMPPAAANDTQVRQARDEIKGLLQKPIRDPESVRQTAQNRIAEMESIKQKIKDTAATAKAENEIKAFKSMPMPSDPNSPIGKVQTAIAKGKFSDAVEDLKPIIDKFPDMKPEEKKKAADEMDKLAKQMNQVAKDTKAQDELKKQLQQMGASKDQLDKLQQAVQGAANGDQQAQQQAQQLANQIAQNINQNGGLTQQQQQQITQQVKQAANQMQNAANNQAAAQQMAGAAQAMANAMQQAAQGNNAQAQGGQAGGQQNAANQAGKGQQQGQGNNQQPGPGQQATGSGPQPADAQAQMKQQLQQMQQAADDAAAIAQGKMCAGGAGQGGQDGAGQGGQPGQQANGGLGEWKQGEVQGMGAGAGGPGVSAGGPRPKGQEAAFGTKQEVSPSHTNEDGKLLASTFIKSISEAGKSKVGLTQAIESAEKDATDEVEQDRISRQAQGAVKRYFDQVKQGVEEKPEAPK